MPTISLDVDLRPFRTRIGRLQATYSQQRVARFVREAAARAIVRHTPVRTVPPGLRRGRQPGFLLQSAKIMVQGPRVRITFSAPYASYVRYATKPGTGRYRRPGVKGYRREYLDRIRRAMIQQLRSFPQSAGRQLPLPNTARHLPANALSLLGQPLVRPDAALGSRLPGFRTPADRLLGRSL